MKKWVIAFVLFLVLTVGVDAQEAPPIDLPSIVQWLLGGGAGIVAFFVIENVLPKIIPGFGDLPSEAKRWISWLISALLAALAYGVAVAMGYVPIPADWRMWIEELIRVILAAIVVAEAIHGRFVLSKK